MKPVKFKNINVNVRHVQHRKIVITQAEKLRDGFFLKTKTQRNKSKIIRNPKPTPGNIKNDEEGDFRATM